MSHDEETSKKLYVKDKQLHHLFELLATKALQNRPENIFAYLRDQLTLIENGEKNAHKHDPSQILYDKQSQHHDLNGHTGDKPSTDPIKLTIAVFGLDNAGKTALIAAMGGNPDSNTQPTVGYTPSIFETEKFKLCVFDLGGGRNFRGIWHHYDHDCHAFIYVVDSADKERMEESAQTFEDVLDHRFMKGKPYLIFANKADKAGKAQDALESVRTALKIKQDTASVRVLPCVAINEDEKIDEGVDWLLNTVSKDYKRLSALVQAHCNEAKEEKRKKLEEQRARVEAAQAQRKLDELS